MKLCLEKVEFLFGESRISVNIAAIFGESRISLNIAALSFHMRACAHSLQSGSNSGRCNGELILYLMTRIVEVLQ